MLEELRERLPKINHQDVAGLLFVVTVFNALKEVVEFTCLGDVAIEEPVAALTLMALAAANSGRVDQEFRESMNLVNRDVIE